MADSTSTAADADPVTPRIVTPDGWQVHRGARWLIHADFHSEETIVFAEAVAAGLEAHPRSLPYRYLYDAAGSEIYERITEQPEYYPTRTEEAILRQQAAAIRELAGDTTLVEFGSGSSVKTKHLLSAWTSAGPTRYVPIDISISALHGACETLTAEFHDLVVEGLATTYDRSIPLLPAVSPSTFVFMGSSIGNFDNEEIDEFFDRVSRHMEPGDAFLLGIDLVKSPAVLEAAYNDGAGWTAAFTRNLFERLNRDLDAGIPLDAVEHVAYWNDRLERIEIYARFRREVTVRLPMLAREFRVAPGEMIMTEISRKFRPDTMAAAAARFGLVREGVFSDDDENFAVLLLRRDASAPVMENRVHAVGALLRRVRARTEEIVAPLSEADLARPPSDIMGPPVWDLGHIADFERLWLVDEVGRRVAGPGSDQAPRSLDPDYDPNRHPRSERDGMQLPSRDEALAALRQVRERSAELLAAGGVDPADRLTRAGFVYNMVAQHESQHQETMLQAIQQRTDLQYRPGFEGAAPRRPDAFPVDQMVLIPGGVCTLGTDDESRAYDNERPRHEVELSAFHIDTAPVSNGEYLQFIEDGGYRRKELWSLQGWRVVEEDGWQAPAYWCLDQGRWSRVAFGRTRPLDPNRPVIHVSWYEADAYARWAGKRLPTEQEWEKAASWDPARGEARTYPWGEDAPTPELANLDQTLLEPMPVGTYPRGRSFFGCHQMLGDVFEWTASDFEPYPGFEAYPYPEYSEVFFGDGYKVLRGASWAVPEFMARNTYRNWDLPQRRQIFAGFRCVRDA